MSAMTIPIRGQGVELRSVRVEVAKTVLASKMAPPIEKTTLPMLTPARREAHRLAAAEALTAAAAHTAAREQGPVEVVIAAAYVAGLVRDDDAVRSVPFGAWSTYIAAAASALPELAALARFKRARLDRISWSLCGSKAFGTGTVAAFGVRQHAVQPAKAPNDHPPAGASASATPGWIIPEERLALLCAAMGVTTDIAYSNYKGGREPDIRAVLVVFLRGWSVSGTFLSYPEIARLMRKTNHSTVIHAESRVRENPSAFQHLIAVCRGAVLADGRGRLAHECIP